MCHRQHWQNSKISWEKATEDLCSLDFLGSMMSLVHDHMSSSLCHFQHMTF
jgi:hypothetical protein